MDLFAYSSFLVNKVEKREVCADIEPIVDVALSPYSSLY
jgi:hypothetical protein